MPWHLACCVAVDIVDVCDIAAVRLAAVQMLRSSQTAIGHTVEHGTRVVAAAAVVKRFADVWLSPGVTGHELCVLVAAAAAAARIVSD